MARTLLVLRGRAQAESGTGTGGERRERTGDEALKGEQRPPPRGTDRPTEGGGREGKPGSGKGQRTLKELQRLVFGFLCLHPGLSPSSPRPKPSKKDHSAPLPWVSDREGQSVRAPAGSV